MSIATTSAAAAAAAAGGAEDGHGDFSRCGRGSVGVCERNSGYKRRFVRSAAELSSHKERRGNDNEAETDDGGEINDLTDDKFHIFKGLTTNLYI